MPIIERRRLLGLLAFGLALPLVSGCGQKGPLYLPPEDDEGDAEKERKTSSVEPRRASVEVA